MEPTPPSPLGTRSRLRILRGAAQGLYLDGGPLGDILMPNRYVPESLGGVTELEAFVYLDSEDRPVATTEVPFGMVGEVVALRVVGVHVGVGAFLDWGLTKDLLLPHREQRHDCRSGHTVVVKILIDEKSGRIIATSRLDRHLPAPPDSYTPNQEVELLVVRPTPLGCEVVVDGRYLGLLPVDSHDPMPLPGDRLRGYALQVRDNGLVDFALRPGGYERVGPLAERVVELLRQRGGRMTLDDSSPPERIRRELDTSKKAFKQALGALYKAGRIRLLRPGVELVGDGAPPQRPRGVRLG